MIVLNQWWLGARRIRACGALAVATALGACDPEPTPTNPWVATTAGETTGTTVDANTEPSATSGGPLATTTGSGASTGSAAPTTSTPTAASGTPGEVTAGPRVDNDAGEPSGGGTTTGIPVVNQWVMMGYDAASTYHNPVETRLTRDNAAQLEIAYRKDMGDNVYGAPLQVDGVLYASSGAAVQAFDIATGERLWRNTRASSTASMAYDNGTLYLHTIGSELVALDASTGDEKFRADSGPTRSDGSSSPIVVGDLVFIGGSSGAREAAGGSFRGWLSALDKSTGASKWSTFTVPERAYGASIWSSVSVDAEAGRVFAGTGNNHGPPATDTSDSFVAFDFQSGEVLWKNQRTEGDTFTILSRQAVDYDFGANPVLYTANVNGVPTELVAAGQKSGEAHAIRRDDGMLVWSRPLCPGSSHGELGVFVNTTWSGEHLLIACNKNRETADLFALDAATGDTLWMTPLDALVMGRMSTANGVGFVGSGKEMVVFDTQTGEILKTFASEGGTVTGVPTIVDGVVAYGEGMSWQSASSGSALTVLKLP